MFRSLCRVISSPPPFRPTSTCRGSSWCFSADLRATLTIRTVEHRPSRATDKAGKGSHRTCHRVPEQTHCSYNSMTMKLALYRCRLFPRHRYCRGCWFDLRKVQAEHHTQELLQMDVAMFMKLRDSHLKCDALVSTGLRMDARWCRTGLSVMATLALLAFAMTFAPATSRLSIRKS